MRGTNNPKLQLPDGLEDDLDLQEIIQESLPIFDQGIRRIGIVHYDQPFWLTRGNGVLRVEADDSRGARADKLRVLGQFDNGGIAEHIFVTGKNLKQAAEAFSVTEKGEAIAIRLNAKVARVENDFDVRPRARRAFFALYRDDVEASKVRREIFGLTYERRYLISTMVRERIASFKRVKIADLDHAFDTRTGKIQPDRYFDREGREITREEARAYKEKLENKRQQDADKFGTQSINRTLRAPTPSQPSQGTHGWFLARDREGAPLRVVIFNEVGVKLPRVVTAYRPDEVELAALKAAIAGEKP